MSGKLIAIVLVLIPLNGIAAARPLQSAKRTVLDGVYTADQALRGEALLSANCRRCHVSELYFANPQALPLRGDSFIDRWREDSLEPLFDKMAYYMPPVGPKLQDNDYVDIIAFLLQANAYPAGATELKLGELETVKLVGKDGPKPLPSQALVSIIGCLTNAPSEEWALTSATEPIRVRTVEPSTAEDLQASKSKPTGSRAYRLRVDDPPQAAGQGKKVQVKGTLSKQTSGDRINVMLMEFLDATCTGRE